MSLRGPWTVAVVLAAFVAVVALTAWVWPRFAGSTVRAWCARVAMIVLCQVAALAVMALGVNQYFDFYSSWNDLLGRNTYQTTPGVGQLLTPVAPAGLTGSQQWQRSLASHGWPSQQAAGKVVHVRVDEPGSPVSSDALLYVPSAYDPAGPPLPAVVALSGYPGTPAGLQTRLRIPQTMDELLGAGHVPPMLVLMLSPTIAPPRDTECTNVAGGPQADTYLADVVPRWLAAHYHIQPTLSVMGVSTGGYCAVKLAMRHPATYHSAVSISGYLHAVMDGTTGPLYPTTALRQANDPLWQAVHAPSPDIGVLLTTTANERIVYRELSQFVTAAHAPTTVDTLVLPSGGHNFGVWTRELPLCLRWLAGRVGPVPVA